MQQTRKDRNNKAFLKLQIFHLQPQVIFVAQGTRRSVKVEIETTTDFAFHYFVGWSSSAARFSCFHIVNGGSCPPSIKNQIPTGCSSRSQDIHIC